MSHQFNSDSALLAFIFLAFVLFNFSRLNSYVSAVSNEQSTVNCAMMQIFAKVYFEFSHRHFIEKEIKFLTLIAISV